MNSLRFLPILALIMTLIASCSGGSGLSESSPNIDQALSELYSAIDKNEELVENRESELDSLKSLLENATGHDSLVVLTSILDGYKHFQIDSFLKYSDIAIRTAKSLNESDISSKLEIDRISVLPLKLRYQATIVAIDSINSADLSVENRRSYYENIWKVYLYFSSVHSEETFDWSYRNEFEAYNDSVLSVTPKEDEASYSLFLGTKYICENDLPLSIATLSSQLSKMPVTHERYSEIASMLSLAYFLRGRIDSWLYYMTYAAISETEMLKRDGEALRRIAGGYYKLGYNQAAYALMVESENNLSKSGAVMRSVHISGDLPMITESYNKNLSTSRYRLYLTIVCLIVLSLLIIFMFYSKQKDRKRLELMARNLKQANIVKEMYISQFLTLCSTYIDKIVDFISLVVRKLAAGQADELYNMSKTDKMVNEQRKMFYDIFDEAFMKIYPTFIEDVNDLLVDGKHFPANQDGHLTPELRILAFMRLGLEGSSQMAKFLGLSVNTVYSYRNRIKSRAKNRDTFESDVANIGIPKL